MPFPGAVAVTNPTTTVASEAREACLVGHSLGASVAMKAASHLGERVARLVLIEPNPFPLLVEYGRQEALAEVMRLRRENEQFRREILAVRPGAVLPF